ncbi:MULTISPECIES: type II secretion system protein N [Pseudomonadaceae]|uniref:type II secretion system protein N n=1 Tax=Pseudomonadaceae TaxID=135621 RepID=UPI00289DD3A6|nr:MULTISPECIES: type II secretion system protein N [Pseudomonadaceae]
MPRLDVSHMPLAVQWLALLAALGGVVTWGVLLFTPAPQHGSEPSPVAKEAATEGAAAQWFAQTPPRLEIKVSGLLATSQGAVAILSINDAPAQAYLVGDILSRGASLQAIEADAVVVEQAGTQLRVAMADLPTGLQMPSLVKP